MQLSVAALSRSDRGRLSHVWQLCLVLGCLLGVRLVALWLNRTDLFFDEAQYWSWGQEPAFGYYSKPPLIAWIIGLAGKVCGDSTFCVRLPAPLIHTATAGVIYLIGSRFLSPATGFASAVMFATLPGVSLSSGIISTDVPLLLAWAVALLAFMDLEQSSSWRPAILLGVALGLGLNAKYAMAFFLACMALYLIVTPAARRLATDTRLWLALAIGGALIAPNMLWNLSNSFATFAHTADNAKWGGRLLNLGRGAEFLGAQLAVFGPVLFVALLSVTRRAWDEGLPSVERLLLCFTLPVIVLITAQAFVSRAHANWAATAYVAGSLLVASALYRLTAERWLRTSLAVHLAVLALLIAGTSLAGLVRLPGLGDPFERTLGWKELAAETRRTLEAARAAGKPFRAVFADDRSITAELLYYMRDEPTPVLAWREGKPRDHYELTRPLKDASQMPALLVSLRADAADITGRFASVEPLGERLVPAGRGRPRRIHLYGLAGYKPR